VTVESDVEHGGSVGAPRRTALLQQEGLGGSGRPGWVAPFVIAAIVGVLVGAGFGLTRTPHPLATTEITVTPDPALPGLMATSTASSASEADRFVQSQVLTLSGRDRRADVARQLGLDSEPRVDVVQVGATDIVHLTVAADSGSVASQAADQLVKSYQVQRSREFGDRVDAATVTVDKQLDDISLALSSAPGTAATDQVGIRSALATEYARLLAVRNQLQLARPASQDPAAVVQRSEVTAAGKLSGVVRGGLFGLLVGALAGLLLMLARQRWARS
jgi:hypothetical protein